MILFEEFMPEDFERLKSELQNPEIGRQLIASVREFLQALQPDEGADADLIYLIGKRFSRYELWDSLPAADLAAALMPVVPVSNIQIMLEEAPVDFKEQVLNPPRPKKTRRQKSKNWGRVLDRKLAHTATRILKSGVAVVESAAIENVSLNLAAYTAFHTSTKPSNIQKVGNKRDRRGSQFSAPQVKEAFPTVLDPTENLTQTLAAIASWRTQETR